MDDKAPEDVRLRGCRNSVICDWRKRAGETGSFVSMRLHCGSSGCHLNWPSMGCSRTKSKFQRCESVSVWRCSSAAACCRASSGDDGKPNRHRFTRDKQPALGTIRGRPPPPKREYEGNIILTSSETGAARTRVLMTIGGSEWSKTIPKFRRKMAPSLTHTHSSGYVVSLLDYLGVIDAHDFFFFFFSEDFWGGENKFDVHPKLVHSAEV